MINTAQQKILAPTLAVALMMLCATSLILLPAHAESLFRANATYSANAPFTPRSIYVQPVPAQVGDIVTIRINETGQSNLKATTTMQRDQTLNENSSGLLNTIIHKLGVPDRWSFPSLDGVANTNDMTTTAESKRSNQFTDYITCQVIQVLPNGNLVVQGQKSVFMNKERNDIIITGIINPYYIDKNNQIASSNVGNLQISTNGQGAVSRQTKDSILNKVFQWFN